mmetsp:Transcript_6843/g.19514  ORF Transcript_6843/g.19514 Transcript_6843/m.19514 type:complete len:207 (+) Transcript_6843:1191-1811(+)
MLERTEPKRDALTTLIKPARIDCTETIISTALPNVALSKPLKVSLRSEAANSSVASPKIFARGINAKKLNQNVSRGPHSNNPDAMPKGTHTSGTQKGCKRIALRPTRSSGSTLMSSSSTCGTSSSLHPSASKSGFAKMLALRAFRFCNAFALRANVTPTVLCRNFIAMAFNLKTLTFPIAFASKRSKRSNASKSNISRITPPVPSI